MLAKSFTGRHDSRADARREGERAFSEADSRHVPVV
jgi:hypothetical protein